MSELVINVSPPEQVPDTCVICSTSIPPLMSKTAEFEGCECKSTLFHSECYEEYKKNFINCPTCRRKMIGVAEELNPHNPRVSRNPVVRVMVWIVSLSAVGFNVFILVLAGLSAAKEVPPNNFTKFLVSGTILAYIPEIFKNFVYLFANRFGDRYITFFERSMTYRICAIIWVAVELSGFIIKFGYPEDIEGTEYLFLLASILAYRFITTLVLVGICLVCLCVSITRG